jgi:hypothetical protein
VAARGGRSGARTHPPHHGTSVVAGSDRNPDRKAEPRGDEAVTGGVTAGERGRRPTPGPGSDRLESAQIVIIRRWVRVRDPPRPGLGREEGALSRELGLL